MKEHPKILLVCLGNICRSPMAEGIMRHLAQQHDLTIELDSCGTGGWHEGEKADPRAIKNLQKHGIDINDLRARQIRPNDFHEFDFLYCMDRSNRDNVLKLADSYAPDQKHKVDLLLNAANPGKDYEVPDPYYGEDDGFERVYQLVYNACEAIIRKLKTN